MYTYKRIKNDFKIQFLERFSTEFNNPFKNGIINKDNTDPHIYNMIRRIVEDPIRFYYEDSIWVAQHHAIETELKLENINKHRSYRILHKLRLIQ